MSKANKIIVVCLFLTTYYLLLTTAVYGSDYALPYPSYMPGNKLYKVSEWQDLFMKYWNFGDIAGIKYERALSDKYLVEAQTLFAYGQYKLAVDSLDKSDKHFTDAVIHLIDIAGKNKDDGSQQKMLKDQANGHIEVINRIEESLPDTITWQEEKKESEELNLNMLFIKSRATREYANH